MVKGVKFRRGTTVEHSSFTGAEGEITIDTDKDIAVVHDGTTVGGKELVGVAATQAITNKTLISATNVSATNATVSGVTTFTNGPVLIGTGTSTGTADQDFQVVGGGYISGNLGVGATNPQNRVHISGSPGTLLRIDGGSGGTGTRDILITEFDTASYGGIIRYDSVADLFTFGTLENSVVKHALNVSRSNGNVGIGTSTTTSNALTVKGNTSIDNLNVSGVTTTGTLGVTGFSTARNLTVVGVTTSSTINDSKGDVRSIPQNPQTGAYILAASDAGKHIDITTGGVTVDASIFSVGDVVTVYNDSGSPQTITQGSNVTLRLAATATTGTRTLAQYGICTLLCVTGGANPVFIISGAGLT